MATLARINEGDIVEVRGEFKADVTGKGKGELNIRPIGLKINRFRCSARDVTRHWRLTKNAPKTKGG
jgi:hypothetical protein